MSFKDKILKNSKIKDIALLKDSGFFNKDSPITTDIPLLNYALSGKIDGGLQPGILMMAGKSKSFKTGFSLVMAKSFIQKYPDGLILFYDSEYGAPPDYWKSHGIDNLDNIIHIPVKSIEELINHTYKSISEYDKNKDEPLLMIVDSLGNLSSVKEATDVLTDNDKADFTKPKKLRQLFRLLRPELVDKGAYMVAINHTYDTMDMHGKEQVSGGAGGIYNSDTVWVISRRQYKNQTTREIEGYDFNINIEKSRYIREGSKFPISVRYDYGVYKWSGMFELALVFEIIKQTKSGWYTYINDEEQKNRRKNDIITDDELWDKILKETDLAERIRNSYILNPPKEEIQIDPDQLEDLL